MACENAYTILFYIAMCYIVVHAIQYMRKNHRHKKVKIKKINNTTHTTGSKNNCRSIKHQRDAITHRGHEPETPYISDVLNGNYSNDKNIRDDNSGNELRSPSLETQDALEEEFIAMFSIEDRWRYRLLTEDQ